MHTPEPYQPDMPIIPRSLRRPVIHAAVALATLTAVLILTSPRLAAQPVFPEPDPSSVTLADEPLRLDAIGLSVTPPLGSTSHTQSIGGRVTSSIILPDKAGVVSIQRRTTTREDLSLMEIEEALLKKTLDLPDGVTGVTIETRVETGIGESLGRSPFISAAGRIIRPFYVRLNDVGDDPYRGFAIIRTSSLDFVLFQLFAPEPTFEQARVMFEVMLQTTTLDDAGETDDRRGELVTAGVDLFSRLTHADYESVVKDFPEQFERIYRPAPGGAAADEQEVGYRRVRAWLGHRDELTEKEPPQTGTTREPTGYLLRIDGLVLLDDGRRADSRSIYYLSRDRRQEAWSVEMAIRQIGRSRPEVWSELGARSGRSMSVQISQGGSSSHTVRPLIEGPGYLSRLESFLAPQLIIQAGKPGEYAYYTYDQTAEVNTIRYVEAERVADRPDLWRITTRRLDEQFEAADFNEYGRLIRSETSDGLIKRPIEFDRLYSIWQSKGLPLD